MRALGASLLILLPLLSPLAAAETDADRAQRALDFLSTLDGVSPAYVVEAASAADLDAAAWPAPERNAFAAMRPELSQDPAAYKATMRIAYAAGVSGRPAIVDGLDLVPFIRSGFDGAQFGETETINDDMWAILSLRAAGVPKDDPMVQHAATEILATQGADGGWGYAILGSTSDVTGMALAALASAGVDVRQNARAAGFVNGMRDPAGGYKESAQFGVNVQSTVWALHARALLGLPEDPASEDWLRRQQLANGAMRTAAKPKGDPMATAEAALYLAGGRHPLPGYADPGFAIEPAVPGQATVLRVAETLPQAAWTIEGRTYEGRRVEHAFSRWGAHEVRVHAVGDRVHARASIAVDVPSTPPVARLGTSLVETDRHALVRPDLAGSTDADGVVVDAEVDWGDGTVDVGRVASLGHAYELPGDRNVTLRVRDDAGTWSAPVQLRVVVRDRAPALAMPTRLVTDRVSTLEVPLAVSDPDRDPVALAWTVDDAAGEGRPVLRFGTLGARELRVTATDPYGASASATAIVEVVDLAPEILAADARLGPEGDVELVAAAADADGPTPKLAWSVDGAPVEGSRVRLPPGAHAAEVVATDAEGAWTSRRIAFVVGAVQPVARIARFEVVVERDALVVQHAVEPPEAVATLRWEGDAGGGTHALTTSPTRIPLGNATEVRLRLVATHEGSEASAMRTALRRDAASVAPQLLLEASTGRAWTGETALLHAVAHGAVAYRFDLGDGNATGWSTHPRAEHAYERPGLYAVVAQARAPSGAVASVAGTILIEGKGEGERGPRTEAGAGAPLVERPLTPSPLPTPAEVPPAQAPAPSLALALALALLVARRRPPRGQA